jgi:hypothetical protein
MATWKAPLLDGELLEHVSTATNMTEEGMHCTQKCFHSHGKEPPKHSNSKELITLLFKVISIQFNQNLALGEN